MSKVSPGAGAPKPRVLLIDDNPHGLAVRKSVLEQQGCAVTPCSSPDGALELFATAEFDLVVTDYRMPKMNGDQVIAAIREMRSDIPVVLVSGMVDVLGLNAENTGADEVVSKNASEVSHMVRAVNRLLHRRVTPKKPVRSQIGKRGRANTG